MIKHLLSSVIFSTFVLAASAEPLTVLGPAKSQFEIIESLTLLGKVGGDTGYVIAGEFQGTFGDSNITFFCNDLFHWASNNTLPYTKISFTSYRLAQLFDANYTNISTPKQSAAMQLAIWEIKYDNIPSISTGNLVAYGEIANLAQEMLNSAVKNPPKAWQFYQYITEYPNQEYISGHPVFEPTIVSLVLSGIFGIILTKNYS